MIVNFKSRKIDIPAKRLGFFGRFSGLMFRSANTKNLLFEFCGKGPSIHSYFVFFDFLAIWLDSDNKVIEVRKIRPWTFSAKPDRNYKKLIEVPINRKNRKILKFFDVK
tara:strand:+ start:5887 stop:6213 length:327 start_codon:yes stop_codon:yes gene_type:complete